MKILYVEDNLQDADLTQRELAKRAPHIWLDIVTTLGEARYRLSETVDFDLILLDLRLPDGSGLELLGEIGVRVLPVVVLTGSGDEETAVAALKAGAYDYLVKQADYLERLPGLLETAVARYHDQAFRHSRLIRVLYVEHNSADIDLTRRYLTRHAPHIQLDVRYSIEEALQCLPTTAHDLLPFDILLLDYKLPGLNALEALKIIRTERHLDLPVVLITGQGNEEIATKALQLGASDYLVKHSRYLLELPVILENAYHRAQVTREQTALAESEARFRRLAENARDIIFRVRLEPQMQIEYVSNAVTAFTGYAPEEFYAAPEIAERIIFDEDVMNLASLVNNQTTSKLFVTIRLSHKDGRLVWVEINPVFVRDENGRIVAIEGIARDITAGKNAEDALRLQGAALEAAANSILITDVNGNIEWANQAALTLTGYDAHELIGQNPRLIKSDMHDVSFYAEMWSTILAGEVWRGELINRHKDGSLYTEEMAITPLMDDKGHISHFIAIKQDISARKAVEADRARLLSQVKEQAQQVQQIIETVPEGVLLLDGNGRVILANPVAQKDLLFLAQPNDDVLVTLGGHELAQLLMAPSEGIWHEIDYNGRIFEAIARPVGNHEETSDHWVMVINDVTKARIQSRYLQNQERLATVGQLAAGIAHDFNNVMAVITLYAQLLQKTADLSPKSQQHLALIDSQAQHAAKLIRQILDFSRRAQIELLPLDLRPLMKEMAKLLEHTLPENITISLDFQDNEYIVRADPTRLQQAMMNLVFNARDAMIDGGKLSFSLSCLTVNPETSPPLPDMKAGEWVQLEVADTGAGIGPEHFTHLFEPFFTTKEPGTGTGLGLAQVYGIVKQHGGSIDVKSNVGEGTAFTIYLPRLMSMPAESAFALADDTTLSGTEAVLLVEDNEAMRLSVADSLAELGYQVIAVGNGKEALAMLGKGTAVSLLLTDYVMPEMGGRDLCRIVHKQYPHIKMLLMTGYPLGEDNATLREDGITDWIKKPFLIEALARKIRKALN